MDAKLLQGSFSSAKGCGTGFSSSTFPVLQGTACLVPSRETPLQEAALAQQGSSHPCTGLGTPPNITVVPSVCCSDPFGHPAPPKTTGSFQQPQSLTWGLPHFPEPLLPAPSIYSPLSREPPPFPAPPVSSTQPPHSPQGAAQSQAAPVAITQHCQVGNQCLQKIPRRVWDGPGSHREGFQTPELWDLGSDFLSESSSAAGCSSPPQEQLSGQPAPDVIAALPTLHHPSRKAPCYALIPWVQGSEHSLPPEK